MKVWITKHALTQGVITQSEGEHYSGQFNGGFRSCIGTVYYADEWHLDEATARLHAEHLRVEALRKARAEVERLERMEF